MSNFQQSVVMAAISVLTVGGCVSDHDAKEFGDAVVAPFNVLLRQIGGGQDLCYATAAFARKNERWPKDYAELDTFVQDSDGYLALAHYEHVDFRPQIDGGLVVSYVMQSKTNRVTFSPVKAEQK